LEWSINATTESALGVPRLADLCRTDFTFTKEALGEPLLDL
jgi:hypothetical protein